MQVEPPRFPPPVDPEVPPHEDRTWFLNVHYDRIHEVVIRKSTRISEVKAQIQKLTGISPEQQHIHIGFPEENFCELENDRSLWCYNIEDSVPDVTLKVTRTRKRASSPPG